MSARAQSERGVSGFGGLPLATVVLVLLSTFALPVPTQAAGAGAAMGARIGVKAQLAIGLAKHGQRVRAAVRSGIVAVPASDVPQGILLRGRVTTAQVASTGATPGTVLPVGATAYGTLAQLQALSHLPGVVEVDLAGQARPRLDQSVPAIHATEPGHAGTPGVPHLWSGAAGTTGNGFSGNAGQGTVVGIVDSGIDIQDPDFLAGNSTRVRYLWDQAASGPLSPPSNFTYGRECTGANIDATNGAAGTACGPFQYLASSQGGDCGAPVVPGQATDTLPEQDCDGHGTHVAGIAAGNGRASALTGTTYTADGNGAGAFVGVAPRADLVVVKVGGDLAHIVDGVAYVFQRASALGEPASVNLSLGVNEGPHDGTSMFETLLDGLTGPGRVVSVAAGNQGTRGFGAAQVYYHAGGTIPAGTTVTQNLEAGGMPVFFDIWYPGADRLSIGINGPGVSIPPTAPSQPISNVGPDGTCGSGPSNTPVTAQAQNPGTGDTAVVISCLGAPGASGNGDNEIQFVLYNANSPTGTLSGCSATTACNSWSFTLHGDTVRVGGFNAWAFDQGDYFIHNGGAGSSNLGSDTSTVGASGHNVISVGSWVERSSWPSQSGPQTDAFVTAGVVSQGDLSLFSSVGPTRDGRRGIDVVAPGEMVGSALSAHAAPGTRDGCASTSGTTGSCTSPDGAHVFIQGTSMSAPHTAGAVALMLAQQPAMTPAQARRALADSATVDGNVGSAPNTRWGAGKLTLGPGITAITPASGSRLQSTAITICGVDFQPGLAVSVAPSGSSNFQPLATAAASPGCVGATMPPASSDGPVAFRLDNPDGSTATDPIAFTYSSASAFKSLPPARVLDTRTGLGTCAGGCRRLGPGDQLTVQVAGGSSPAPGGASAVVMNVTSVTPGGTSQPGDFLTIYPTGAVRPHASNLNHVGSEGDQNLVSIPVGQGGQVTIYNDAGDADVLFDLAGYYLPASSAADGRFQPQPPARITDTRSGSGAPGAGQHLCAPDSGVPGGSPSIDVQVGGAGGVPSSGAEAVVFNLTETNARGGAGLSFLSAYPSGGARPAVSNLNFFAGETRANRVTVPIGAGGRVTIFNNSGCVDVVADVNGWYTDTSAPVASSGLFTPLVPTRLMDTRTGTGSCGGGCSPLGPRTTRDLQVRGGVVPAGATAVVLNATVVASAASPPSFLTVYPDNLSSPPLISDQNYFGAGSPQFDGQTIPNLVVVQVGPGGGVAFYNNRGQAQVIVDALGYFT